MAFTRFFLEEANAAFSTLDRGRIVDLILPSCKSCSAILSQIDEYSAKQQKYVGDFSTPTYVTVNSISGPSAQVFVTTDTKGAKVVDAQGGVVRQLPPDKGNVIVGLEASAGFWQVSGIQGVS